MVAGPAEAAHPAHLGAWFRVAAVACNVAPAAVARLDPAAQVRNGYAKERRWIPRRPGKMSILRFCDFAHLGALQLNLAAVPEVTHRTAFCAARRPPFRQRTLTTDITLRPHDASGAAGVQDSESRPRPELRVVFIKHSTGETAGGQPVYHRRIAQRRAERCRVPAIWPVFKAIWPFVNTKSSFFRGNSPLSLHFQSKLQGIVGIYTAIRSTRCPPESSSICIIRKNAF